MEWNRTESTRLESSRQNETRLDWTGTQQNNIQTMNQQSVSLFHPCFCQAEGLVGALPQQALHRCICYINYVNYVYSSAQNRKISLGSWQCPSSVNCPAVKMPLFFHVVGGGTATTASFQLSHVGPRVVQQRTVVSLWQHIWIVHAVGGRRSRHRVKKGGESFCDLHRSQHQAEQGHHGGSSGLRE